MQIYIILPNCDRLWLALNGSHSHLHNGAEMREEMQKWQ